MDEGFSLTEVMVAATILLLVLGGMTTAMVGSVGSVRDSRERQRAVALAADVLERVRTLPPSSVALRTGDPTVPASPTDPDGAGPMPAEAVVVTATGPITGAPYATTTGRHTVRTIVTWYDDPVRVGAQDTRRVTTTVSWTTGSRTERVVASTLLSTVTRSVP